MAGIRDEGKRGAGRPPPLGSMTGPERLPGQEVEEAQRQGGAPWPLGRTVHMDPAAAGACERACAGEGGTRHVQPTRHVSRLLQKRLIPGDFNAAAVTLLCREELKGITRSQ